MEIINYPTHDEIKKAAKALKDGHLVAFPTETVYGLGADATNEKAVSRIYHVKGRPTDHPLIVHISSINQLDKWAIDIPDYAIKLARGFWPGPMTLILPKKEIAKDFITGGQNNVGLRVPAQPIALALLKKFEDLGGQGVAAPSANRFGAVSPTTAEAVCEELGNYFRSEELVLDGGQCLVGIESTIIDCTREKPVVLRPGFITEKLILQTTGLLEKFELRAETPQAPGMLKSHYSPKASVQINVDLEPGDGLIALSNLETPAGVIRVASPNNIEEFGKNLYINFRKADELKLNRLVVFLEKQDGYCEAIFDRCLKASEPLFPNIK